ncbi:MAG: alpha/beta hydrolase [Candidatus Thiodiazotropha endolucinida]
METKAYLSLLLVIVLTACSTTPELSNPQLATVGSVDFRYVVQGETQPVVVFESGFATPMGMWHKVFPEVATFATAFTYSRRGYAEMDGANRSDESHATDLALMAGGLLLETAAPGVATAVDVATTAHSMTTASDEKTGARTAKTIVEELRILLHQTGMPPPYVLVGHSIGGLYSLYYAKAYPDEVAGLVLVDSSHPEQVSRCREKWGDEKCKPPWLLEMGLKLFPDAVYGEWMGKEIAGQEVIDAGSLPAIPLVVLTRDESPKESENSNSVLTHGDWLVMQQELAALSPRSQHIVVEKSGHFIQEDEPGIVIKAIRDVIDAVQADIPMSAYKKGTDESSEQ